MLKMTLGVMAMFTHSFLPVGLPAELSLRSFSVLSCTFFRSSSRAVSGVGQDSWSRFGGSGREADAEFESFSCCRPLGVLLALSESASGLESFRAWLPFSSSRPFGLTSLAEAFSLDSPTSVVATAADCLVLDVGG